jgi:antitoxin component YwqK of YwqJK toxin-antitoxin module
VNGGVFKEGQYVKNMLSLLDKMEQINQRDSQGRFHGLWKFYYTNDILRVRYDYHHGMLHGLSVGYRYDGSLWWKERFDNGIRRGLEKNIQLFPYKTYHLVIR